MLMCVLSVIIFATDARDTEQLKRNNITRILSIHDSARPMLEVRLKCGSARWQVLLDSALLLQKLVTIVTRNVFLSMVGRSFSLC